MNRELIVKLLKKNIDDLILLTDGFEEMTSYPRALIHLAQLKTNDIKEYLYELSEWKQDEPVVVPAGTEMTTETFEEEAEVIEIQPDITQEAEEEQIRPEEDEEEEEATEMEEEPEDKEKEEPETEEDEVEEQGPELIETDNGTGDDLSEPVREAVTVENRVGGAAMTEPEEETPESTAPALEPKPVASPAVDTPYSAAPASDDKKSTLGERLASGMTRNEMHSTGETDRWSNSLANKKIDDIRQAISIGDRFRFQRELFRNNGEEMNKMLNYINLLASYQEIEAFLQKKYGWSDDNEAARDLYAIVRRKFL